MIQKAHSLACLRYFLAFFFFATSAQASLQVCKDILKPMYSLVLEQQDQARVREITRFFTSNKESSKWGKASLSKYLILQTAFKLKISFTEAVSKFDLFFDSTKDNNLPSAFIGQAALLTGISKAEVEQFFENAPATNTKNSNPGYVNSRDQPIHNYIVQTAFLTGKTVEEVNHEFREKILILKLSAKHPFTNIIFQLSQLHPDIPFGLISEYFHKFEHDLWSLQPAIKAMIIELYLTTD